MQRYKVDLGPVPRKEQRDIWIVGTFRKAEAVLERRFIYYKISIQQEMIGLLCMGGGVAIMLLSIINYNKAPQKQLLAKLIRAKWEEIK